MCNFSPSRVIATAVVTRHFRSGLLWQSLYGLLLLEGQLQSKLFNRKL